MGKKIISKSAKLKKSEIRKKRRNQLSASMRRRGNSNLKNNSLNNPNSQESKENIIREIIQSLDTLNIDLNIKTKFTPLKHKFPEELNNEQFISLFLKGIEYAKNKYKFENLKNIKIILNKYHDIDVKLGYNKNKIFSFLETQNELEKIYKMDLLLSLVSDETITDIHINQNDSLDAIFSKTKEYVLYAQKELFIHAKEYKDENVNKNIYIKKFEELLYSKTILNTYKEVLNELYNVKLSINQIKKLLIDFRKSHKIYFIEMPLNLYGLTLFNGTILISNKFLDKYVNNESRSFIIFFTLFHEYTHILSRLVRGDNNFFRNTGEFLKALNLKIGESGKYFENQFLLNFLKKKSITDIEAEYLLNKDNYIYDSSEEFGNNLKNFIKNNQDIIKQFPRVSIGKNEDDGVKISVGCGCAGIRLETLLD